MTRARRVLPRLAPAVVLAIHLSLPGAASAANPEDCGDGAFAIEAPTPELGDRICTDLLDARDLLLSCGLVQSHPIAVEVVAAMSHPIRSCMSYFDCDFNVINIMDPAGFDDAMEPGTPYSLLPSDVLLDALLTHELAHALVVQTAGDRQIDIVDQEYIAAALELEHMDAEWREVLLEAAPVRLEPTAGLVDILIYGLSPRKFATNAWQHFHLEENGCPLVGDIVQGRFTFAR